MQGRVVPRLIGFTTEAELEFFELFCTVDKVGTRKAIKALVRPDQGDRRRHPAAGRQMADDAARRRAGHGGADRRHAAAQGDEVRPDGAAQPTMAPQPDAAPAVDGNVIEDAYQALLSVGHSPHEARDRLDKVLGGGQESFTDGGRILVGNLQAEE